MAEASGLDDDALVGIAARIADGESIDWESEEVKAPGLRVEIRWLRWLGGIAEAGRSDSAVSAGAAGWAEALLEVGEPASVAGAEPITLVAGATWGPLTIREPIASGGVGDVFRAWDPQLEREVALKLWRETATRTTTGTEARRLARVRHPGILSVHGSGRHGGCAGMWTDLIDGRNLEQILATDGPFGVAEARRIGIALSDALAAMHQARLVHRDVKTSNVMLAADGRVVLIDFGSAKELLAGMPEYTRHMRGTPLAAAPEVLRGARVGPAADVYGLGVLLYRLVTGAYPIEAQTLRELLDAHRQGRGVPLRGRRADLPESLVRVIEQALSADPARRPRSMVELGRMLERMESTPRGPSGVRAGLLRLARWSIRRITGGPQPS